jgi:UDP-3-O-[3-hydroxymyristoyl] glucosamine N-acyltransferase
MTYDLTCSVAASELATRIAARLHGPDVVVTTIAAIGAAQAGSLTYLHGAWPAVESLPSGCCVIARDNMLCGQSKQVCVLESPNPRLDFIRLLHWIENEKLLAPAGYGEVHASVSVHPSATIDSGAHVGAGCEIGPGAYLGSGCHIGSNVSVGAGSVLGHAGFGYERDEDGVPVRFPHIGKVIVDDECEIGCNTTIARGNLQDTRLRANVKVDDQVYIAHNCEIGDSTMIAGGATICGGVVIGSHCWIGAGAMIKQGIEIGAKAIVGLGAVVVNAVAANTVVAGNPARLKREG